MTRRSVQKAPDEESVQRRPDEEADATDEPALAAEAVNVEGALER